ncbi:hypothetical protein [Shewanella fidelis]|uniref:Uncharacterized protein n=1 Tax=Shewanella fidelis TaxID=173509 RepID=A0AAW8NIN7_9GAMM|nr:hypothetical protein [Shewanella fidelis]MDR8522567.1 hypothetical protein [Shewanella fidelis]MDW4812183.1 hypothetical protein [Shewanella fidelis]MDW4816153.1 hypothetical protein [Shewanella fidelis]MDW4820424.1 hypothetical protein [Shewanella fidelis]MDW4824646.1 hypothetical protein [Shewanella fidelis]
MIDFKYDYLSLFLNALLNALFIIVGTYLFLNQDTILEDQFGRAFILMLTAPIFTLLLINLLTKAYKTPKKIVIDFNLGFLAFEEHAIDLNDLKCIDFIYKRKRIFLMVENKKGEIILNTKANYWCNKSIDDIKEVAAKFEIASVYYR